MKEGYPLMWRKGLQQLWRQTHFKMNKIKHSCAPFFSSGDILCMPVLGPLSSSRTMAATFFSSSTHILNCQIWKTLFYTVLNSRVLTRRWAISSFCKRRGISGSWNKLICQIPALRWQEDRDKQHCSSLTKLAILWKLQKVGNEPL